MACPKDEVVANEAVQMRAAVLKEKESCQEICSDVDACREDPHAHDSYCKFEESNPICFGM